MEGVKKDVERPAAGPQKEPALQQAPSTTSTPSDSSVFAIVFMMAGVPILLIIAMALLKLLLGRSVFGF